MAPLPEGVAKSLAETKVEYRRLGNSGLRVSVPIVGCMSIGNPEWANWVIGPEKALPLLKAAYDRGVNTVCAFSHFVGNWKLTEPSGILQTFIPMVTRRGLLPKQSRNMRSLGTNWCWWRRRIAASESNSFMHTPSLRIWREPKITWTSLVSLWQLFSWSRHTNCCWKASQDPQSLLHWMILSNVWKQTTLISSGSIALTPTRQLKRLCTLFMTLLLLERSGTSEPHQCGRINLPWCRHTRKRMRWQNSLRCKYVPSQKFRLDYTDC